MTKRLRKTSSLLITGLALTLAFGLPVAFACMWDSNTIRDELNTQNVSLFHLITGQFPHHGQAFYEQQAREAQSDLAKNPKDTKALNNLGAAYTKLGKYDEALQQFQTIENIEPGKYETTSNLGVLHNRRR